METLFPTHWASRGEKKLEGLQQSVTTLGVEGFDIVVVVLFIFSICAFFLYFYAPTTCENINVTQTHTHKYKDKKQFHEKTILALPLISRLFLFLWLFSLLTTIQERKALTCRHNKSWIHPKRVKESSAHHLYIQTKAEIWKNTW